MTTRTDQLSTQPPVSLSVRHTATTQKLSRVPRELSANAGSRFTLMCWVRLVSSPPNTYNHVTSLNDSIPIGGSPAVIDGVDFIRQTGSTYGLSFYANDSNIGFNEVIYTTGIAVNTWYHVAVVRTSDTQLLGYINGVLRATVTHGALGSTRAINALDIGGVWTGPVQEGIDGRLAQHRTWRRALSQAEIAAELRSAAPVSPAGLGSWYEFGNGAARLLDSSGAARHLTYSGAIARTEPGPPALRATYQPLTRQRLLALPGVRAPSGLGPVQADDTGAGADTAAGALAATLADTGAGVDALTAAQIAALADTGGGADTLTAAHAATLADTGAGADAAAGALAASLADTATGADAVSATPAVTIVDTGTGADAAAGALAATLADTGSGADAVSGALTSTIADTGAGADAVSATPAVTIADTGAGADAASSASAATIADTGAGADVATGVRAATLADTGAGADAVSATPSVTVADTGAAADVASGALAATLADVASGADAASGAGPGTAQADDTGAGADALAAALLATLADTGAGADAVSALRLATLADLASGADAASAIFGGAGVTVQTLVLVIPAPLQLAAPATIELARQSDVLALEPL